MPLWPWIFFTLLKTACDQTVSLEMSFQQLPTEIILNIMEEIEHDELIYFAIT